MQCHSSTLSYCLFSELHFSRSCRGSICLRRALLCPGCADDGLRLAGVCLAAPTAAQMPPIQKTFLTITGTYYIHESTFLSSNTSILSQLPVTICRQELANVKVLSSVQVFFFSCILILFCHEFVK